MDFADFEKNYRLIAVDLSKQKALDADSRAIQQIIFTGKTDNQIRVYYILEQSKETILKFSKGTTKVKSPVSKIVLIQIKNIALNCCT